MGGAVLTKMCELSLRGCVCPVGGGRWECETDGDTWQPRKSLKLPGF